MNVIDLSERGFQWLLGLGAYVAVALILLGKALRDGTFTEDE